jgi:enoyl-CoA hydratase/carnithine racemase
MSEERRLSTSDIAAAAAAEDRDAPALQAAADRPAALFAEEELTGYRARWSGIQTGFVDEPRKAVEEADALVAALMKRLAEVFADERRQLEAHWEKSDKVSTEDLRIAMQRYRSFFERLLSI